MNSNPSHYSTDVCIVGGGPAGMMLALLLAKAGIRVLVLEQHSDFEREFRGEVLMPRFMQMLEALNLYQDFGEYHHVRLSSAEVLFREKPIAKIDFKEIAPESPAAIWMPQPILLDAFFQKAREFPSFKIWFNASPLSLVQENGKNTGLRVKKATADGGVPSKDGKGEEILVSSSLVVGADGRFSAIRRLGNFETVYHRHAFDIVWFNIPKPENYENTLRFYLSPQRNLLALPKYPNLIQCGMVVEKDEYMSLRKSNIVTMRKLLLSFPPLVHDFARKLTDFKPFHVLQAELDLIREWAQDGLLVIGDAAHTCSPVGAVGVSAAVETAIVAADVILRCVKNKDFSKGALQEIQSRREVDIREIHKIQNQFAGVMISQNPLMQHLLPFLLPKLFRLPFVRSAQRHLAVLSQPLKIDPSFAFEEL